jgi:hypothetical protein
MPTLISAVGSALCCYYFRAFTATSITGFQMRCWSAMTPSS